MKNQYFNSKILMFCIDFGQLYWAVSHKFVWRLCPGLVETSYKCLLSMGNKICCPHISVKDVINKDHKEISNGIIPLLQNHSSLRLVTANHVIFDFCITWSRLATKSVLSIVFKKHGLMTRSLTQEFEGLNIIYYYSLRNRWGISIVYIFYNLCLKTGKLQLSIFFLLHGCSKNLK